MQRKYNQMEMCHFDRFKFKRKTNEIHFIRLECLES